MDKQSTSEHDILKREDALCKADVARQMDARPWGTVGVDDRVYLKRSLTCLYWREKYIGLLLKKE